MRAYNTIFCIIVVILNKPYQGKTFLLFQIYILKWSQIYIAKYFTDEALLFCQPRGDTSVILIDAYQAKTERYTPVDDWWSPPPPPLVRLAEQVLTSARTRRIGLHWSKAAIRETHLACWHTKLDGPQHRAQQRGRSTCIHGAKLRFIR